jgi:mono/diheme cytochrome c family protein
MRTILIGLLIGLGVQAKPDTAILENGKKLYNAAGSCVACHMADGKGQPGSIPPLAGSGWLKDNPDRTIAIVLRGLAGPILVDHKRYYGAMPPQLMFDDEQIALMVTYVNNAWGNKGAVVEADRVAKLRKELPMAVYTPETILKAFPFKDKKLRRGNGTYKPDFDDELKDVKVPVVYRTFMPGASPAAFAVALPGNQFYCWDAGECRLRYVWTKGGFIKGNQIHWSSNGKPTAEYSGVPYYRARSSLLKPEHEQTLYKTNNNTPIYDTTQADDFPIKIAGAQGPPRYLGYRLVDGFPEFRYALGGNVIRELIRATADVKGIDRVFNIETRSPVTLSLTPSDDAVISASVGTLGADGTLALSMAEAKSFTVTIIEKNPGPLVPVTGGTP